MAQMVSGRVRGLSLVVSQPGLEPAISGTEPARERTSSALDDAAIAALDVPKSVRKVSFGDSLNLWLMPNGSRLWRLHYKLDKKPRTYSIGPWGREWTVAAALAEADRVRAVLDQGLDPVKHRQQARVVEEAEHKRKRAEQTAALTSFKSLAEEWFTKQSRNWSPAHKQAQRSRLDREILPVIGSLPLGMVDAPAVLAMLEGIERRGRHELLAKCRILTSLVMRYGVSKGKCKDDPTAATRGAFTAPDVQHRATVTLDELPELFEALGKVPGEAVTKLAFAWCAATCCRTIEMRLAKWSEIGTVDVTDKSNPKRPKKIPVPVWRVPQQHTKMRREWVQPLSSVALEILERAKKLRTSDDGDALIFPGFSRSGTLSENALLSMLARAGYFQRQTTHGLRSLARGWMHDSEFDAVASEMCLAHEPGGVFSTYMRSPLYLQRLAILEAWADELRRAGLKLPQ